MHERDEERDRGSMIEKRDDTGATWERRGPTPRHETKESRDRGIMRARRGQIPRQHDREKRAETEAT